MPFHRVAIVWPARWGKTDGARAGREGAGCVPLRAAADDDGHARDTGPAASARLADPLRAVLLAATAARDPTHRRARARRPPRLTRGENLQEWSASARWPPPRIGVRDRRDGPSRRRR